MKRSVILCVVLSLAVAPLPSAEAADLDYLTALEGTEVLTKISLAGGRIHEATVEKLDNGMVKMSIPMGERARRDFAARRAGARAIKDLQTLGCWATLLEEDFRGQIVSSDMAPLIGVPYLFYFVVANFGDDAVKKAKFILKGSEGFKANENVEIDGGEFNLFFVEHTVEEFGPRKLQIKVTGAGGGKLAQNPCFDCAE